MSADMPATVEQAVLGTQAQIVAERTMLELLDDLDVRRVQQELEGELAATGPAQTSHGRANLMDAIVSWTATLILREIAGDPAQPSIMWTTDDSPHSWHGFTVPGRLAYGDNPDFIYRATFFDGAGSYQISGRFDLANRPAQLAIEFMRSTPGDRMTIERKGGSVDFGNQFVMLTDRDLHVQPDGSFRIVVNGDGKADASVSHVELPAEPVGITFRDVLSDWRQAPARLEIRRLDTRAGEQRDKAALKAQVLADLPHHLRFWGTFPDKWFGRQERNKLTGPFARDGGWGYIASLRFELAADEAIVVRTASSGASYTGVQLTSVWGKTPDVQKYFSSINSAQAVADPDGGFTYVASPRDPGCANWLDTSSLNGSGGLGFRWQGFPADAGAPELVREMRIVKLSELGSINHCARISPDRRAEMMERRVRDFRTRLGQ